MEADFQDINGSHIFKESEFKDIYGCSIPRALITVNVLVFKEVGSKSL